MHLVADGTCDEMYRYSGDFCRRERSKYAKYNVRRATVADTKLRTFKSNMLTGNYSERTFERARGNIA